MSHPEPLAGCRPPPDAPPTGWASPLSAALGFALGVCLFFILSEPPPAWPLLGLLAAAMAWLAWYWAPARPLCWLLVGLLWAQFRACDLLCHPFPAELARVDLRLEGRVASLPESKSGGTRFQFRVERAWRGEEALGFTGLVRLTWRGAPPLRVGEARALGVRLKPPHGFANPGGFDYERWLFQQGIVATGYVRDGGDLGLIDPGAGPYWIDRWRQGLSERLGRALAGSPAAGLVQALVLGEDTKVTPAQWEVLTRTGVNHLVSISGLHVGLVAASLF
ncbi:MAG: ComEC/Rec2 family competence protein, partial [Chromatiaceae bacterium]